ncbi:MAG TPA: hypothetical protein VJT09_04920 [Pyrinomonadaceae bacterium]|nr:hypothetical protein [Pyrinomonadaceae bacterium]
MLKFLASLLLLFGGAMMAAAQGRPVLDTRKSVRIDVKKPAIYLEFVRVGTCSRAKTFTVLKENPCQSKREDVSVDTFDAVWLRARNNSRWSIELKTGNIYPSPKTDGYALQDGRMVAGITDGVEMDVEYDVEAERGYERVETAKGVEYKFIDVQAPYISPLAIGFQVFLPPGRSVVFAVRREHLAKFLSVFLRYVYEWETSAKESAFEEPRHRVYFSYYKLEKALEKLKPNAQQLTQSGRPLRSLRQP